MSLALFPGCIARNMYPGIEKATYLVFKDLGLGLEEVRFTCCPAPGVVRSHDHGSWLAIAARNLAAAEAVGSDIVTICSGCFGTLDAANRLLREDRSALGAANERLGSIGMRYRGDVRVRHFVDLLDERLEEVRSRAKVALGLNVAIHYGCHYLRPSHDEGRNVESPAVLERMVRAMGCHSIEFPEKLSCCGAGGGVWSGDERLSLAILDRKMRSIKGSGADCILDICPFCHLQLDQGQRRLEQAYGVPVLHLSQLLGLAFGHKEKPLGVHMHMVPTRDVTRKARALERPGEGGGLTSPPRPA